MRVDGRGWLLAVLTALMIAGCASRTLGIMPGVVNDPGNRSLRRGILRFGLESLCTEMTTRGTPLRMRDDQPIVGRFFARTCNHQELESGDVFVQFSGEGYVWTNLSLRLGFNASGSVQYNQDFLMDGSTMYAYFRTRTIASKEFRARMVERGGNQNTAALGGLADPIAEQIMTSQLTRGFTVIRDSDGSAEFAVGLVDKGKRPSKPFVVTSDGKTTLANERSEIQGQQVDFFGPFHVDGDGKALYFTATIDGVQGVDALLVSKDVGDQWLAAYISQPGVPQPPAAPIMAEALTAQARWIKAVPVPEGFYYLVLDNSSAIGSVAPPATGIPLLPQVLAASQPAALASLVAQVGDAP